MITPTVGRVLHYHPSKAHLDAGLQPMAALVAKVHGDRMINIGYFNEHGTASSASSVTLVQEGDALPESGGFCLWMPYQRAQAAKEDGILAQHDQRIRTLEERPYPSAGVDQ